MKGDEQGGCSKRFPGGVTGNFDRRAWSYHAHTPVQAAFADWLAEWLPQAWADKACLELGAGTGHLTRHLLPIFRKVVATDAAPAMVAAGRTRLPKADWRQEDAWNPSHEGAPWPWLVSSSLLQLAEDPLTVLSRWRALLANDGRLVAGWFVSPTLEELARVAPTAGFLRWRDPVGWFELLECAGWKIIRVEVRQHNEVYADAKALFRSLHGSGATSGERQFAVGQLRRILNAYDQAHRHPTGGVSATWAFLRLEAVPRAPAR